MKKDMHIRFLYFLLVVLFASSCKDRLEVTVSSPDGREMTGREVELAWDSLKTALPGLTPENLLVRNTKGDPVVYQILYTADARPYAVLLQADIPARGHAGYTCEVGEVPVFTTAVYGRFVPERKDDFAWENNRVAFRMYGPALERTGEISNGMDIWAKRTEELVIDRWYKQNDYHRDHGEGCDFYKVGRSLGAGMAAPVSDGHLVLGRNYTRYEILENGPLRFTFRLHYAPFEVGGIPVTETRTLSLSAGSRFNKVRIAYTGDFDTLEVAAGIVLRGEQGVRTVRKEEGFIAYEEPTRKKNGTLFVGVMMPGREVETGMADGHLCIGTQVHDGEELCYYSGYGWSKAGTADGATWLGNIRQKIQEEESPLTVTYR